MDLPIDYRRRPFKAKYIDEETQALNRWFIFGTFADGTVGISDGTDDIFKHVPPGIAEKIISARNQFVQALLAEIG